MSSSYKRSVDFILRVSTRNISQSPCLSKRRWKERKAVRATEEMIKTSGHHELSIKV